PPSPDVRVARLPNALLTLHDGAAMVLKPWQPVVFVAGAPSPPANTKAPLSPTGDRDPRPHHRPFRTADRKLRRSSSSDPRCSASASAGTARRSPRRSPGGHTTT